MSFTPTSWPEIMSSVRPVTSILRLYTITFFARDSGRPKPHTSNLLLLLHMKYTTVELTHSERGA
jgi:hypothetical protein